MLACRSHDVVMGVVGVDSLELLVLKECCVDEMDEGKLLQAVTDL